ncbi:MerR family DNA-binding transcriptional regulator [Streptomyces niveus]|uniref:MerR family DNA-binding transcriptional regulator n=1 Tax=Streptomyces niveus TaxID=193462 RepID=UPI00368884EE
MNHDLTAGEFQALTGLTAKALRLYAERGILAPAAVDPDSGYRRYSRSQFQNGVVIDLLRRAQVPLSELATAPGFPFERWRETVEMKRLVEDFYLDVAEQIATFNAADFTAHSTPAPALDWVGFLVDLGVPEDVDGGIETFSGLAVNMPAAENAFSEALADLGVASAVMSWTAVPDLAVRKGNGQVVMARPGPVRLSSRSRELIERRVHSSTGQTITVVSGTLPRRIEVTFSSTATREVTPVEEAACGYLHTLAFEEHRTRHHLTAIAPTARQVSHGESMFPSTNSAGSISVFDVHPAT